MNRLSVQSIMTTLAALGTSALVGCASNPPAQSPVEAHEVEGAQAKEGGKGNASCSAAGCGGHADAKADEKTNVPASAPADAKPADAKADVKDDAKPADAKADAKDAKKDDGKKKKKGGGGPAASCGPGTCSAQTPAKKSK